MKNYYKIVLFQQKKWFIAIFNFNTAINQLNFFLLI